MHDAAKGFTQKANMPGQQRSAAVCQRNGEEETAAGDAAASVVGHYAKVWMGFATALPILR